MSQVYSVHRSEIETNQHLKIAQHVVKDFARRICRKVF